MKEINEAFFTENILDLKNDPNKFKTTGPTILKFGAGWCGPCKMMEPVLEEISEEYKGKVDVYSIDVDSEPAISQAFGVRSIPYMVFVNPGETPQSMSGALPKSKITEAITDFFKV